MPEGSENRIQDAGELPTHYDEVLFFRVSEEQVSLYTFQDRIHDYDDLNEAARLAASAYADTDGAVTGPVDAVRERLERAIAL